MKLTQLAYSGALLTALLLSACGGGGGDGGNGDTDPTGGGTRTGDDVADTLTNLNIDTSDTPRVDAQDAPLPDSYTPIGKSRTLEKKSELFLAGTNEVVFQSLLKFKPGVSNVPGVPNTDDAMEELAGASLSTDWKNSTVNDAVTGDIDGDGVEEIITVWWSADDEAVRLRIIDDEEENFNESSISVLTTETLSWIKVIAADFNGDGADEIALALVNDSLEQITVSFLTGDKTNGFSIDGGFNKTFFGNHSGWLGVEWTAGQLDLDAGEEIALVVNEIWGSGTNQSPGDGRSDYYLFDDANHQYQQLSTGRVSGDVGSATHNAVVSDIDMGDLDGDGRDEIVLAGLADDFPIRCDRPITIQFILDDGVNGFANLGTHLGTEIQTGGGCESSANNTHIEHVWVNAVDIDGDQYAEIQINGVFYEDLANATEVWDPMMVDTGGDDLEIARIPFEYIFVAKRNYGRNSRNNTIISAGDVTADGREDILVYSPQVVDIGDRSSGNLTYDVREYAVTVWGIDPVTGRWGKDDITGSEGHIGMLYFEALENALDNEQAGPLNILPVNVDTDSTVLKFSEGSYQLIFSEPILHAALAAPPCYDDGSQITSDCRTAWGQGSSTGANASLSHEVSVKHHTGVKGNVSIPIVGDVGVEVERSVGISLKAEASLGYELSKTITYTTGAMEDTVVATVIPYDQYTYTILSHPVYPDLVGKGMVISLPRSPRTMQINRDFYNNALVGDGVRIDTSVFQHTIGDVSSYPSRSNMLSILNSYNGKSIGPVDVGASSGNTNVTLSESIVAGFTTTIGISYETTVKATGGKVMSGFSVGSNTEASLGFSVGRSVIFSGTVGEMPADTFDIEKAYSYGLFAYKQSANAQDKAFQVINYWVE